MRAVFAEMTHQYQSAYLGKTAEVLWESGEQMPDGRWLMKGLTGNYLRIETISMDETSNKVSKVKITGFNNNNMTGINF
jgi:tRNA A37 methylthiotransferase MiaB